MKTNILILLSLVAILTALLSFPKNNIQAEEETTVTIQDVQESKQEEVKQEDTVKVKKLDLTKANLSFLTSEVNSFSVDQVINDITAFNKKDDKDIHLIIDSPGGSVMDGARLVTVIEGSKNKVVCIDVGLAASMAFIILEHCHVRYAIPRATLMAHPASLQFMFSGEVDKITSRLNYMKRFIDVMDMAIAKRAKMSYEKFKLLSQQELWLESRDALKMNLLDGLVFVNLPSVNETTPNSGSNAMKRIFGLK